MGDILPGLSEERGECAYCLSVDQILVVPSSLADFFRPLVNIYEPNEDGKLLVEWFKADWAMFDHERMDVARSKDLLANVLDDGEIVRKKFVPSPRFQSDALLRWEQLRDELMYGNRYFPNIQLDAGRLEQLLQLLPAKDMPAKWYRARICQENRSYKVEEMGPPPRRIASHGRANPAGIPYLYVASTPETSAAEVRPHTGERVGVATFTIPTETRLLDLRNPRRLVSPIELGDEDQIGKLRSDIGFLERLGEELTRPVLPQGAAIDYVPSQYLCEFTKKCGYDGVVYRSAVGEGINLALFKPDIARPNSMLSEYVVERVAVQIQFSKRYSSGFADILNRLTKS
ncbi:RES family NAD+ phosphorylase [Bradyrhizobium sp. AT1]|uniref:RES family NAD+ phosphorylase n=1 Tax=Bradyrhizobium sp. AT1 TaxID=574934 RepID=UPI001FDA820E|nr:RES family NAD+ phosphorylase [Bradyrhizobium sp. AT1]